MIDTIKLEIPQHMYTILDHGLFTPSTKEMFNVGPYLMGTTRFSKQNSSAVDRRLGIYKPRLSVTRRQLKHLGYQNTLYVELSLPKLVFGNNFDELTDDDLELVLSKLTEKLKTQGVYIFDRSKLTDAKVSSIHFGKNIVLSDYSTPFSYIKELMKIDVSNIHDVNQTDYRNGGLSYKIHSNLFEYTCYDKLKDLERSKVSESRAINNDDYCQLGLFDQITSSQNSDNPFQVIRIEMRLNSRKRIRQTLKKYAFADDCSFSFLFSSNLASHLVSNYFKGLTKQYIPTFKATGIDLLDLVKMHNPKLKERCLLEVSMAQEVIQNSGVRKFRNTISNKTWYRIKKLLKNLNVPLQTNLLTKIWRELTVFIPLRLIDYPQLMINNDKNETN